QLPSSITPASITAETYRTSQDLRRLIGLETAHGREEQFFGDANRRRQASRDFRIIERITRRLAAVRATAVPHPMAASFEEVPSPGEGRVRIQSLALTRGAQAGVPGSYNVRLQMTASPAVLLEAGRQLDGMVEPIVVRLGSRWQRQAFGARDKHSVADVPLTYETQLLVLDFFDPAQAGN
ncbi:MAG: hypothetical protein EA402_06290, partial [Planctomycetota bacterium]